MRRGVRPAASGFAMPISACYQIHPPGLLWISWYSETHPRYELLACDLILNGGFCHASLGAED